MSQIFIDSVLSCTLFSCCLIQMFVVEGGLGVEVGCVHTSFESLVCDSL